MRIVDMNWMQVEAYLKSDDRCVLPIGSTEQHAYLSLGVDLILAEKMAIEAAEPLGVPVFPVMPYGVAPYFAAFPGSISLRAETLLAVVEDLVRSVHRADGWTPQSVAEHMAPAFRASWTPLERSGDVFSWDPL